MITQEELDEVPLKMLEEALERRKVAMEVHRRLFNIKEDETIIYVLAKAHTVGDGMMYKGKSGNITSRLNEANFYKTEGLARSGGRTRDVKKWNLKPYRVFVKLLPNEELNLEW